MTKLKVKLLDIKATVPSYATDGSAGLDLTAVSNTKDLGSGCAEPLEIYGTGLAFEIPEGHVGLLFPRSSIRKQGLLLSNCVGVIDSDYRGEVSFAFRRLPELSHRYSVGDRVGQLVILELPKIEIEEVTYLTDTLRGAGGFGSTGQ